MWVISKLNKFYTQNLVWQLFFTVRWSKWALKIIKEADVLKDIGGKIKVNMLNFANPFRKKHS